MIKPSFLEPTENPTVVGHVFGTPLVVKGWTWFPVIELVMWAALTWVVGKAQPDLSRWKRLEAGALSTIIMAGSEWCHNLAHAAAARWIGKPMDAMRITWGTPLLVYFDINDQKVTPRQHVLRSLGGPAFNALMIPIAWIAKQFTSEGSVSHYLTNLAMEWNTTLATMALLPIPGIDGGPVLKWSLVGRGYTAEKADEMVKGVNRLVGPGLGIAAGVALKKRRPWLGALLGVLAAASLAIGFGLLREQK